MQMQWKFMGALLFLAMRLVSPVAAQDEKSRPIFDTATEAEMKAIRSYEADLENYLRPRLKSARFFAPIFNEKTRKFVWREFASKEQRAEANLKNAGPKGQLHQQADVWMRDGKPVGVHYYFFSGASGGGSRQVLY